MLKPLAIRHGELTALGLVIFRSAEGDAPAIMLNLNPEHQTAAMLVFDRAMAMPGRPTSALLTNQPPPVEVVALGRVVAGVPHVQLDQPIPMPSWGSPDEFYQATHTRACPGCDQRAELAEETEARQRFLCASGHEVIELHRSGLLVP